MENTSGFIHNNQYSLSIRFNSDGFSFYVYDVSGELLSKKNIKAPILSASENAVFQLVSREIESKLVFKTIRIICESDIYSIIPDEFFSPESASDFLSFEHKTEKNEKVIYSSLPRWNNTLVAAIPVALYNALKKIYPEKVIEHHIADFLSLGIIKVNADNLFVLTRAKMLDIVLIRNSKIELINSYSYNTPEDYTYFVLNIYEKLSLSPESFPLKIYQLGKKNEIKELLQKYVEELEIMS